MVNPFVNLDEQLKKRSLFKRWENEKGFRYVKVYGDRSAFVVDASVNYEGKLRLKVFDQELLRCATLSEQEMELFTAKMKEWRRRYGRVK